MGNRRHARRPPRPVSRMPARHTPAGPSEGRLLAPRSPHALAKIPRSGGLSDRTAPRSGDVRSDRPEPVQRNADRVLPAHLPSLGRPAHLSLRGRLHQASRPVTASTTTAATVAAEQMTITARLRPPSRARTASGSSRAGGSHEAPSRAGVGTASSPRGSMPCQRVIKDYGTSGPAVITRSAQAQTGPLHASRSGPGPRAGSTCRHRPGRSASAASPSGGAAPEL